MQTLASKVPSHGGRGYSGIIRVDSRNQVKKWFADFVKESRKKHRGKIAHHERRKAAMLRSIDVSTDQNSVKRMSRKKYELYKKAIEGQPVT